MSAAVLTAVLANQETTAEQYRDADLIDQWRAVADAQRHHNP